MNQRRLHINGDYLHLSIPNSVMEPSPYSLLLAEQIPNLHGQNVADVGTGSGLQAIVAKLRGAARVYLLDNNPAALQAAMENAQTNGVADGVFSLPPGDVLSPLPNGILLDTIICNPASLPMPRPDRPNSPYFSGADGRRMIERLICQAQSRLRIGGNLYMVHTSLADYPASERLLKSLGFQLFELTSQRFQFRYFYDRNWIDTLGGSDAGLYIVRDGEAHENVRVIKAELVSTGEFLPAHIVGV